MTSQANICKTELAALRDYLAGATPERIAALVSTITPASPLATRPGAPAPLRAELRDLCQPHTAHWHALRPLASARREGHSAGALVVSLATLREIAWGLAWITYPALPTIRDARLEKPRTFRWQRRKYQLLSEFSYDLELPVPPGCRGTEVAPGSVRQVVLGARVRDSRGEVGEAFWLVSVRVGKLPVVRELEAVWMLSGGAGWN